MSKSTSKASTSASAAAPSSSPAPKRSTPLQLGSFTVLPVIYTPTTIIKKPSTHYLYIRPNAVSPAASEAMTVDDAEVSEGRTLFVANLPPDATEESLRILFGHVGPIEEIKFGGVTTKEVKIDEADDTDSDSEEESEQESDEETEKSLLAAAASTSAKKKAVPTPRAPTITPLFNDPPNHLLLSSSSAKVIYLSTLSLTRALQLPFSFSKPRAWPTTPSSAVPPMGLSHYLTQHATLRPPLAQVKAHADSSLAHHEHLKAAELARLTKQGQQEIVDEDGFTLVVRGGRYGRNLIGGGVGVASKRWDDVKEEETGRKKKSKELKDFYRWQLRESKREDLANLRSKFAADKEKVEKLKSSRRFKPY